MAASSLDYNQINNAFKTVLGRVATAAEAEIYAGFSSVDALQEALYATPAYQAEVAPIGFLYATILGRLPDAAGLTYWIDILRSGRLTRDGIVGEFVTSYEAHANFGFTPDPALYQTHFLPIAQLYLAVLGRIPEAAGLTHWVNILRTGQLSLTEVAAEFLASDEAQLRFGYLAADNTTFVQKLYATALGRAGSAEDVAHAVSVLDAEADRASIVLGFSGSAELAQRVTNTQYAAFDAAAATRTGTLFDGYIRDAVVFADADGNDVWNEGEAKTTTNGSGRFTLTDAKGVLIASGGIDITSNLAKTGQLTAIAGANVINPLTTLHHLLTIQGNSPADAQAAITKAFGIDVDIMHYDALAKAFDPNLEIAERTSAIKVQAVISKVENLIATASKVLMGAPGPALSATAAVDAVYTSLARTIQNDSDGVVNFDDPAFIKAVLIGATTDTTNSFLLQAAPAVQAMADHFTVILAEAARRIDKAANSSTDIYTALANIGKVSTAAQGSMADQLKQAAASGRLDLVVGKLTGFGLETLIRKVVIGDLDPLSHADLAAIIAANAAAIDPEPDPDTTAPTLSSSIPADNATAVAIGSNIVLTFSEAVVAGTGSIVITNANDGADTRTISIIDTTQVTISGNTVTINPGSDLLNNGSYNVQLASGVIRDLAGNAFAGITNSTALNFTTPDTIAPSLSSSTPADDATAIAIGSNIVLTFSEAVAAGTGNIVITNVNDGADTRTISITDATQVTISGNTVTINPGSDLLNDGNYNVQLASGVITDLAGNNFAGITNSTALNFTTPDTIAPTKLSSTPADNATAVAIGSNIVLTFSEAVVAGTGNIVITNANDGSDTRTINITDATQVTISGNMVTINPTVDLLNNGSYNVQLASGVITDLVGNAFAGITDATTLNFTTPDTIAPTKLSSTPADNATAVAIGSNIVLTFSEAVAAGTGNIVITNANNGSDTRTISITDATQITISGNTVTINPSSNLLNNSSYNVQLASGVITDLSGNAFAGITNSTALNFTTPDTIAPTLSSSTPADNATAVAIGSNIVLTFSEAVAAGTGNIMITNANDGSDTRTISISDATQVTVSGNTVTINPSSNLLNNGSYNVQLASGVITDLSGNAFAGITNSTTLNFTTPDTIAPSLSSSTPADDATAVAVGSNIVLTFSEAVAAGTGNIMITNANDGSDTRTISISDATQVTVSGNTVTINPSSNLLNNSSYNVQLASGAITDLSGNAFAGITNSTALNFTTPDTIAPSLSSSTPADDATAVAIGSNIVLTFSEAVATGTGNIVITNANDGADTRTISISDTSQVTISGNTVTINPGSDLLNNGNYNVQLASGVITDLAGNPFAGITNSTALNFTTPDTIAPTKLSSTPADNATAVAIGSNIVLTFSEAVAAGTGNIVITNANDGADTRTISITDTTQVTISGNTVTINPAADLLNNTSYNVQLASGVITDLAGNPFTGITNATTLNFTTPDTTPPTLSSSTPADNATAVAIGSNIVLTFSEAVATGTGNIVITNANDGSDTRTISITDATQITISGNTVTINPSSNLLNNSSYNVQLASGVITDLSGNAFAGITNSTALNFTTPDTVAPTLSSSTPADNATAVAIGSNIVLTFSEAVAAGTGNIVITNANNGADTRTISITDATQVTISGNTVTINPSSNLLNDGSYNVQLASGVITDLAGNNFAGITNSTALNFTTPDTIAPTKLSSTPADNATAVAIGSNIVLTFSEAVAAGTGNIVITNANDGADTRTISISDTSQVTISGNTVTINPGSDLLNDGNYNVQLASGVITDLAGNNFAGITNSAALNFTTPDTITPTKLSNTPADNATAVAIGSNIVLTFSEAVAAGTGNIVITNVNDGADTRTISITDTTQVTISGNMVTVNPASDLLNNTSYNVQLSSGVITDLAGNAFAGITNSTALDFTTPDTIAPTFSSSTPADNATAVAIGSNIVLTFSEAVATGTGNIVITNANDGADTRTISISDTSQVTISGNTVTINPGSDLLNNGNYNVQLASGVITDLAGNNFAGITNSAALNFTTPDTIAPTKLSSTPADNATAVAIGSNIVLTFSEAVAAGTGNIVITNVNDGADTRTISITDATQVTISGNTVTINPAADLLNNTSYNVQLASGVITDLAGNAFAGITNSTALDFTTPDTTAPTLSSSTPADNATAVAIGSNIVLTFSEAIAAGTGNIVITNANNGADTRTISISDASQVTISGNTVTINPSSNLLNNSSYNVQLASGVITDLSGNAFAGITNSTALNFTTPDTVAPTLSSSTPADNATAVAIGSNIVLTFSEAVAAGTGNIMITNANNGADTRTISISDATQVTVSGNTVTINPTSDLLDDSDYNVQLASGVITDVAGNNFAGITNGTALNFTTLDMTAPTLSSSTPADNATAVAVGSNIVLTFSEAVVAGTGNIVIANANNGADTRTISITDATQVTISGNTVTINPTANLLNNGSYNVQLASGVIKDLIGNNFAGITNSTTLNFATPDTIAPTLTSSTPADNTTAVAVGSNVVLTFSEAVAAGTGNIVITNESDATDTRTISITDTTQVTISGNTVTINPATDLHTDSVYNVQLASGVIKDPAGNNFSGIADGNTLDFTTTYKTFSLANLNGSNGFMIHGAASSDESGSSVSNAGDINGDGFGDLIIGALYANPSSNYSGAAYVVFGKAGGFGPTLDLLNLGSSNGFRIDGVPDDQYIGNSVSAAGDINNDGIDDLIVGAPGTGSGASYVILGKTTGFSGAIDLTTPNSSIWFRLDGANSGDFSGNSVSAAGDINGDGIGDLIIGSPSADLNGTSSGSAHVVFGKTGGFSSPVSLSSLNGTDGFRLNGETASDVAGGSVSTAGDVNGDGFDDLIIGAEQADPSINRSGSSYIVFGRASGFQATMNLANLDGSIGFRLDGLYRDHSGSSVSTAGDINGDGYDDLIVGAHEASFNGSDSGSSYIVFGKAGGFAASMNLEAVDGNNGFRLDGVFESDAFGNSVSAAGDVNGDGFDDLIIGAYYSSFNGALSGSAYVVFGKAGGFSRDMSLSDIEDGHGFRLDGVAAIDLAGSSVSAAGDVNGDGFDDMMVGAPYADPNGHIRAGSSYVIFGGDFNGSVTQLGTSGNDILTGTAAAERFVSGLGNDTMTGGGGADVFYGGEGNDRIEVADLNFHRIDGGTGTDTLKLSGAGMSLNLASVRNRIDSIEKIDLTGSGNNTLTLSALDLRNLSDNGHTLTVDGNTLTVDGNTLTVDGNAGDTVVIESGWTNGGSASGYRTYTMGTASLRVADAVTVSIVSSAPTLISSTPTDNATLVPVNSNIVLTFNEAVMAGTGNIEITNANNGADTRTISVTDTTQVTIVGNTLIVNPTADLLNGANYYVQLASGVIKDLAGNNFSGITTATALNFTTPVKAYALGDLNGSTGFRIDGISALDSSGTAVRSAGDVNGDGFDDVIIGAPNRDSPDLNSGASYVVFGKSSGFSSTINLNSLTGTNGFRLDGEDEDDLSGISVSAAGDVNGDGIGDMIVGARFAEKSGGNTNAGSSYVVFGTRNGFSPSIDLSVLNGTTGFRLDGIGADDLSGNSVSNAGDINGDGYDDIIIGAQQADPTAANSGASYVVFGKSGGFSASIDLNTLNGTNGFRLNGVGAGDFSGISVSTAGDVNGDGFDDLIIGATGVSSSAGASYVVFGKAAGFAASMNLSSLKGSNGFRIDGAVNDNLGKSVSSAGDVNGDGFDDLIVGTNGADPNGTTNSGSSYVIFGRADAFDPYISASTIINTINVNQNLGFRLDGGAANDYAGISVSAAGDFNGDGFDDLIVGAYKATQNGILAGSSYVVFGRASGLKGTINLSSLNGTTGFRLDGKSAGDASGISVSAAGDVNGDGFDDILVGANAADPNGVNEAGSSYVIFGSNFTGSVTHLGTSGSDTLTGTAATERFVGGNGNDTMTGGGGNDVFYGGEGDDVIQIADLNVQRIDGGNGIDTLRLTGADTNLNLTSMHTRIDGIEKIDITGTGDNTLKLSAIDLRNLSSTTNTLIVDGNAGDTIEIGLGWTDVGIVNSYRTYTQGSATLQVATAVTVTSTYFPIAALDGTAGFRVAGEVGLDRLGHSVNTVGDINGDGFDDLIVTTPIAKSSANHNNAGISYVIFGKDSSFSGDIDLASLNGSNGFRIEGAQVGDRVGSSASSAGDVNGDGFDDLLIGARGVNTANSDVGASYVIFGKATGFSSSFALSSLDGTNGFRLHGTNAYDRSGFSVSTAGDIDDDGFADLIIGAPYTNPNGIDSGSAYVVFGKASGFAADIALSTVNSTTGFRIDGLALDDYLGHSVSTAGDINGDGFDDLIIGAKYADSSHGKDAGLSYVIFGKKFGSTTTINLATPDASTFFRIHGEKAYDYVGISVKTAGDVNNDGYDDLIIGARGADAVDIDEGTTYIVFGKSTGFGTDLDLKLLDGTNGFRLHGVNAIDYSGNSVSTAGDINGDGFDDLIIGAEFADPNGDRSGAAYVVYGKASGFDEDIYLSALDGTSGFRIDGVAVGGQLGHSVSTAGDINGDGFDDLVIGAYKANATGEFSGASYVIFGGNGTTAITKLGTSGNDALTGTAAAERFIGGIGDDTMTGGGGADVFYGGTGNDTIRVSNLNFQRVDGGTGIDTLELLGSGMNLNLATLRNRIEGIEKIKLTGSGNNTLTLSALDLRNLNLNLTGTEKRLTVDGNAGDVVDLDNTWTYQGTAVNPGYNTYANGTAILLIATAVTVDTVL